MAQLIDTKSNRSLRSLTDCMYFVSGNCRKGDTCTFRHCRVAAEQINKCNKWPNTCRNVNCRYRHPSLPTKEEISWPMDDVLKFQPQNGVISFFWDIENVSVPRNRNAFDIVQNIRQLLVVKTGLREIGFTCYGDIKTISVENQLSLAKSNVRIVHVPDRKPGAADRQILLDLDRFERAQRPPATVVLISADIDFVGKLSDLRHHVGYHIIVIHNKPATKELKKTVHAHYEWNMFTQQSLPASDAPKIEKNPYVQGMKTNKPKPSVDSESDSTSCTTNEEDLPLLNCPICANGFSSKRALRQHQDAKRHVFTCPVCDDEFFSRSALGQHQHAKSHEEKFVRKDPTWQNILKAVEVFQQPTVTGLATFIQAAVQLITPSDPTSNSSNQSLASQALCCPRCTKTFDSEDALQDHQRDTDHIFECSKCYQSFFLESQLSNHQQEKHDESDFKCPSCHRSFKSKGSLHQHKQSTGHFGTFAKHR